MLHITVTEKSLMNQHVDGYVVFCEEGFDFSSHRVQQLSEWYSPLQEIMRQRHFTGKANTTCVVAGVDGQRPVTLIVLGVGNLDTYRQEDRIENYRRALGHIIRIAEKTTITKLAIEMPQAERFGVDACRLAQETVTILDMASYHFDTFITEPSRRLSRDYSVVLCTHLDHKAEIEVGVEFGLRIGHAVNQARLWCDLPPVNLTPTELAEHAARIAKVHNLGFKIFDKKSIIDMGMGGIHAVSKGSAEEPRLVVLEYKTEHPGAPTIALVGKGVTFDSGGLSIKPASGMETMKDDMAGAAAVISTMEAISHLKPRVNVIGLAPIAENMPSGTATRPGDIIRFYNGKTAEVRNTDAEGRLILADAMSYAVKHYTPDYMVTIATLTGSCAYALGPFYAGLMTQNDFLADSLLQASRESGDRLWRLPFHDDYRAAIRNDVADLSNDSSARYRAGAITAGFFLSHFAGDVPFVHLDIAGTAFDVPDMSYYRSGATAFGVRLFVDFLMNWK